MSTSFLVCMVVAVTALIFWRATLVLVAAALIAILITGVDVLANNIGAGAEPTPVPSLTTPDVSVTPEPGVSSPGAPAPEAPTQGAPAPTAQTSLPH
jgi:hypothetical protein